MTSTFTKYIKHETLLQLQRGTMFVFALWNNASSGDWWLVFRLQNHHISIKIILSTS